MDGEQKTVNDQLNILEAEVEGKLMKGETAPKIVTLKNSQTVEITLGRGSDDENSKARLRLRQNPTESGDEETVYIFDWDAPTKFASKSDRRSCRIQKRLHRGELTDIALTTDQLPMTDEEETSKRLNFGTPDEQAALELAFESILLMDAE